MFDVPGGNARDRVLGPVGVEHHRKRLVGHDALDLIRPDAGRRIVVQAFHRRAARHEAGRGEGEHVQEGAVGRHQLDRDPARGVVGLDAGDRGGLALLEFFGAGDVFGEKALTAPAELDRALDRVGEVRGLDRRAV